jgi:replicative DNA helicase
MSEDKLAKYRDIEAERAAVGAMLIEGHSVVPLAVSPFGLCAESWFDAELSAVAQAAFEMFAAGRPIDVLTMMDWLRKRGVELSPSLLEDCIDACVTAANAAHYLGIVRSYWMLRRGVQLCRDVEKEIRAAEDPEAVVLGAAGKFGEIFKEAADEPSVEVLADRSVEGWEKAAADHASGLKVLPGLPTPWEELDDLTLGHQPGLILLAARPSAGKSTMEDAWVYHLALQGVPVGRVLLDMTLDKGVKRAISRMAEVSLPKLERGYATHVQREAAADAARQVRGLPIYQTGKYRDVRQVCSWGRAMHQRHGIQLLTVDFIQLMNASSSGKYFGANEQMSHITAQLKALSHELKIPVVALSQLNRAKEKENRKPQLSDLRDGGSLEQDASQVVFLYQDKDAPEGVDSRGVPRRHVWVDVQKNQNGEIGGLEFFLYANYFKFVPAPTNFGLGEKEGGKK